MLDGHNAARNYEEEKKMTKKRKHKKTRDVFINCVARLLEEYFSLTFCGSNECLITILNRNRLSVQSLKVLLSSLAVHSFSNELETSEGHT